MLKIFRRLSTNKCRLIDYQLYMKSAFLCHIVKAEVMSNLKSLRLFCQSRHILVSGTIVERVGRCREVKIRLNVWIVHQAPVVQRLDNAIHRINRSPADKC